MSDIEDFVELVKHLCTRPKMYVPGGTFDGVCAYLTGYARGAPVSPLAGDGWTAFNRFVCATSRFPSKYAWWYVVKQSTRDDVEATATLQRLLTDFAELTRTKSFEEIVADALARASEHAEGEPEKAWRRFSRAIHRGRRAEIEPLIQAHPDADVLWSSTYPPGVAPVLDEIQESYDLSQIAGSETAGDVTIITPDFGPVSLKRIGDSWRVDASKIIDCWKANRGGRT